MRVNRQIRIREIYLIDEKGEPVGNVPIEEGQRRANDAGLDLVEINPNGRPPVCKIMDYGKYKYRMKKKKAGGTKAHQPKLKEVRFHPRTSDHDLDVRIRQATKFLEHGDKVLVTCQFKGREMAFRQFGMELMDKFKKAFTMMAKIEREPGMEGNRMTMMLTPLAVDVRKKLEREAEQSAESNRMKAASDESGRVRRVIRLGEIENDKPDAQSEQPSPSTAVAKEGL